MITADGTAADGTNCAWEARQQAGGMLSLLITDAVTQKQPGTMFTVAANTIPLKVQCDHLIAPQNYWEVSFSDI